MKRLLITAALMLAIQSSASAEETLKTTFTNEVSSPLQITECSAMLLDTEVGNIDYWFQPHAVYSNKSHRDIKAIEIRFTLMDGFDTVLTRKFGIDSDGVEAGRLGGGTWKWIGFPQATSEVTCSVAKVKFTDGATWINPAR
jgi:hypothetical protein